MAEKVVFSPDAEQSVDEVMLYLNNEISERAARKFWEEVKERIAWIGANPEAARLSPKNKNVRYVVVRKRYKMHYGRNESDELVILSFFDSRQHPDKNPYG